ncbi:MAG: histidine kinase [Acidobacteriales bacterium]|nr:histidine kinase [Terriglobales bacterium]
MRNRTSHVLHDEVSQVLSAVGLQLDVLRMDFAESHPEVAERTAEIQQLLEKAIDEVRNLSRNLDPSMVERAGLHSALNRLVGRVRDSTGVSVRLLTDPAARVAGEPADALYRIAEQALDNAVRHSGGAPVEILLRPSREGVVLEIRDLGIGFDVDQARSSCPGLGLILMEYQAMRAGLDLSVASAPGKGTIVKAVFRASEGISASPENCAAPQ